MVKEGVRILGLDDGEIFGKVLVVGVIYKLSRRLDGLISFFVEKDGRDSTERIIKAVRKSRFGKTINYIMTNGIAFGGFNIFDIKRIYEETGIPVIVIITKMPNFGKIKKALEKFKDFEERWKMIERAGKVYKVEINRSSIYYQIAGISRKDAEILIKRSCVHSKVPEPVRLAHIIASGIANGESKKKV